MSRGRLRQAPARAGGASWPLADSLLAGLGQLVVVDQPRPTFRDEPLINQGLYHWLHCVPLGGVAVHILGKAGSAATPMASQVPEYFGLGRRQLGGLRSWPPRLRTWTFLIQSQACCQLHQGPYFYALGGLPHTFSMMLSILAPVRDDGELHSSVTVLEFFSSVGMDQYPLTASDAVWVVSPISADPPTSL